MKRVLSICLTLVLAFVLIAKVSQAQAACVATNNGGLTGSVTVTGCSGTEVIKGKRAKGTAPAGVTTNEGCIGYSQGQYDADFGNGTYTPQPGPGQCEQIDVGSNGVARYGGASKVCGDTCTSNADCINPSANGAPVACVAGKCANTACAAGMTIPGANCSCGANTRLCGQTCSGTLGLCGPGQGTCTYVNTNGPYCPWGWSQTYCAGSANGYKKLTCTSGDAPGGQYLVGPTGKVSGFTAAEIAASCQVCGNGTVETGEQCDMGANNGKPGYPCDASCKKVVSCNQICTSDSDCGAVPHIVNISLSQTNGAGDAVIDYIKDGTTIVDDNSALLAYTGTWVKGSSQSPYGGAYASTTVNGSAVNYKTLSPTITFRTYRYPQRGTLIVKVDGVVKQTITDLNTGSGWYDVPVTVSTPSQYACTTVSTGKVCRLRSNPTDATCATSTPAPTTSPLVCDLTPTFTSTGSVSAWKYGDMISFAVGAVPSTRIPVGGSARYEGQAKAYRGITAVKTVTLTPINATASQFQPMKVDVANSTYYFRFRYCVKTSAGVETCSNWGAWAAP